MCTKRPVEEKMINSHFNKLYQINCYKTKSNFSQLFFSHWLLYECFYSCLISVCKFWKIGKILSVYWQAFIIYGENVEILKEKFRQKLIVSKVILAFLDQLKSKFFFVGQPWWSFCVESAERPLFQNLWIRPWQHHYS